MTVAAFIVACGLFWWCLFMYVVRHLIRVDGACLYETPSPVEDPATGRLSKTRVRRGSRTHSSMTL